MLLFAESGGNHVPAAFLCIVYLYSCGTRT
jgi:hypothetical protein